MRGWRARPGPYSCALHTAALCAYAIEASGCAGQCAGQTVGDDSALHTAQPSAGSHWPMREAVHSLCTHNRHYGTDSSMRNVGNIEYKRTFVLSSLHTHQACHRKQSVSHIMRVPRSHVHHVKCITVNTTQRRTSSLYVNVQRQPGLRMIARRHTHTHTLTHTHIQTM